MTLVRPRSAWYDQPLSEAEVKAAGELLLANGHGTFTMDEIQKQANKTRWDAALKGWLRDVASNGGDDLVAVKAYVARAKDQGLM